MNIPLWLKIMVTLWALILIPSYAIDSWYGLLWFCNVGLVLTVIGLWTENSLIISMPAVGNVAWLVLWWVDVLIKAFSSLTHTETPGGPATYMFNGDYPIFARVMSLYHGWLPFVLIFALRRLGYDRRALLYQTMLAWALILMAYTVVPDWRTPAGNVDLVFGYSADQDPVLFVSRPVWIAILLVLCPLCLYLPVHFAYRRFFPAAWSIRLS